MFTITLIYRFLHTFSRCSVGNILTLRMDGSVRLIDHLTYFQRDLKGTFRRNESRKDLNPILSEMVGLEPATYNFTLKELHHRYFYLNFLGISVQCLWVTASDSSQKNCLKSTNLFETF